jgi:4-hydroxythreonine-4-phosphate dehydrogenase
MALQRLLQQGHSAQRFCVLADPHVLQAAAHRLGLENTLAQLKVRPHPCAQPVTPGVLNRANAAQVLALLDDALSGCLQGRYRAMVTAPVHKGIINDAGIAFTGHTEYLAEHSGTRRVVMLLTAEKLHPPLPPALRVALATTHLPLKQVSATLSVPLLLDTLNILQHDLQQRFGIAQPRLLVCGLNPHAGEGGHLGREDIDIIEPALQQARQQGLNVIGPLPADTLFQPARLHQADAVLAMYHDQGLPVLKFASFGSAVNVTLGLPFVRTSVDHGTALDLAGSGRADCGSLISAIELALQLTPA